MKRSRLVRSAWVRHTPFSPNSSLKRKVAVQRGAEDSEAPSATLTQKAAIRRVGKKGQEWITARAWLKRHFKYAGIITCEARLRGCYFDDQLSWAHCKKRRKLEDGEIYHVALLCVPCHSVYERMSHEDMHSKIHEIIDRRGLIAPK